MRVALTGGSYQARSIIASCQRCLNLVPELIPQGQGEPVPAFHYQAPGLTQLAVAPIANMVRGLWCASNGQLFAVVGSALYYVSATWAFTQLGAIGAALTPVSMTDNGTTLLLVDGTTNGYTVDLGTHAFAPISDAAFYGADRVDFIDTFLLFNKPGTPQFYSTQSDIVTPFNSLYFANKTGFSDLLATLICARRQIWLIGEATTEIWYDAGAAAFPFQILPGPFIEHGCAAKYSVAKQDAQVFWLSKDLYGTAIAVRGVGYEASRISTFAVEAEWQTYSTVSDAIGFCYQQDGHAFYFLTFPTADKTWVFDGTTNLWHERCWLDGNGVEHRHRANCYAFAYGVHVVGDWETGAIYSLSRSAYTDNGAPIKRLRSFPHIMDDARRVHYAQFIADVQCGTSIGTTDRWDIRRVLRVDEITQTGAPLTDGYVQPILDGNGNPILTGYGDATTSDGSGVLVLDGTGGRALGLDSGVAPPPALGTRPPRISLRWSDTRGAAWGSPVMQSMGATGDYRQSVQWRRLGMARDRVFELSWSEPLDTALIGAFIETQTMGT